MRTQKRGFLLVAVLLVLLVVSALGVVMLSGAMQDATFVQHEIAQAQAEEIARSGLAYYQVHGVPSLVNGQPQKLHLFPESNFVVEIAQDEDTLTLTGTMTSGSRIQAQAAYRVPLWDLHDIEPVQDSPLLR